MARGEFAFWMLFALSAVGLFFPEFAAGEAQDPGPLRLMAFVVFVFTGAFLADHHLLGSALLRSIAPL